ncbi:queuosine 5'-phosphate N-glycosylase/hydrolase isoform X1 [Procambarus clarkii]|uniref:queuosine 5'-phosphate N-glycosylase/hydrolase isoform X1 n=1 Tax=Procambarus clarkii TaxID=6728 RepID=UPI001E6759D8|nr:queuosine salvage protein-like [Procambarus clarkii]XP_045603836.1 queuosine salvage protein-like [Procambarus clarkii]
MLWPREAAKFISSRSKDVRIAEEGVRKVAIIIAELVRDGRLDMEGFKQNEVMPLNKGLTKAQLADWIFLVDSLNFNFWTPHGVPKYTVVYEGKKRTGYMAMVAAINRAIDEGKKMYDPKFYSKLTIDDVVHIFRSDTVSTMPLFEERIHVLKEVGNKLIEKYDGTFVNVLRKADGSAMKLIDLVTNEFPCFQDIAFYEGQSVALFKRVQILAADLWMLYHGEGLGAFTDIDSLTMFADYRVPQAMAYFGVLKYSDSLMEKLRNEVLFQSGDREEVEIRGCSIQAAELIVSETCKILDSWNQPSGGLNSVKVDYFLWDFRLMNATELDMVPYHRVRCIYY